MKKHGILVTYTNKSKIDELIGKRSYKFINIDDILNNLFVQMSKHVVEVSYIPIETTKEDLIERAKNDHILSRSLDVLVYERAFYEIDKSIDELACKNELFFVLSKEDNKYLKYAENKIEGYEIFEIDELYDDISLELLLDDKIATMLRSK